jgi:Ca2+-binding RTX toxin-like protein
MKMKRLFALSALAVLGVVSYLVLAANVPCHLLDTLICDGTPGNDVITYISGFKKTAIIINGKAGNDRILIDFRLRLTTGLTINGDEGNDTILDSDSGNSLWGGDGNDRIFGNGGDDYIDGGPGNDLIDGGPGKDTIIGGGGNDTFILRRGDAGDETQNIVICTTTRMDRGVIRLVGFSRQDLLLQGLQPGLLPSNTVFEIRDGTTGKFNINTGQGRCMLAVSAP